MLYNLLAPLAEQYSVLNLFNYLTVRASGAFFTALILSLAFGPKLILWLKAKQQQGKTVRDDHPEATVQAKAGTPSMGGLLILATFSLATLLWSDLLNPYIWLVFLVTLSFGLIGFVDDMLVLTQKRKGGIPGRVRLGIQAVISVAAVFALGQINQTPEVYNVFIPFVKDYSIELGFGLFSLFAFLVISGSANAVNLTDGLDGLASVPAAIAAGAFAGLAYIIGRADFTEYLNVFYIPGVGELIVMASGLVGALLGFLWYNAPPARVFMGDTGSLTLGGFLGCMAVVLKIEFVWLIIGGLFVAEAVSVILQVGYFKLSGGKRIFLKAPLHHHFEQKGWPESTIVVRFWIIAFVLALIGLSTLKLR